MPTHITSVFVFISMSLIQPNPKWPFGPMTDQVMKTVQVTEFVLDYQLLLCLIVINGSFKTTERSWKGKVGLSFQTQVHSLD